MPTSWPSTNETTTEESSLLSKLSAIASSKLIRDMEGAPVMASPPTFSRSAGFSINNAAANSSIAGSVRTVPLFDTPRFDPTYRFSGCFARLNNTAFEVGAVQAWRPTAGVFPVVGAGGAVGPTGMTGWHSHEFNGQVGELLQRDHASSQYLVLWVSKNGGPFRPHVSPQTPQEFTSPGHNSYMWLRFDMGEVANWRMIWEGEAWTFGGINLDPATSSLRFPSWPTQRLLVFGDSYAARGNGIGSTAYVFTLARKLGLEPHNVSYGGTGIVSANEGGGGSTQNFTNYYTRIANEVTPFFTDEPPAVIYMEPSINDVLEGPGGVGTYAGSAALATALDNWLNKMQTDYPSAHIVTSKVMRPYRGDYAANALEDILNAQVAAAFAARKLPAPHDVVADVPFTTTIAPSADVLSDTVHPTPLASQKMGTSIGNFIINKTLDQRPYSSAGGAKRTPALSPSSGKVLNSQLDDALWTRAGHAFVWSNKLTGLAVGEYIPNLSDLSNPILLGAADSDAGIRFVDLTDFPVPVGKKLYWRFRFHLNIPTVTAPGSTFDIKLKLAGTITGGGMSTIGAQQGNTATFTPAGATKNSASTGWAVLPSSTFYVPSITISGSTMAGGSVARFFGWLEYKADI